MVSTTFDGTPTFLPIQQDNAATKLTTTTESQSTAAAVGFEQLTTTATAAAAVGVPSSTASSVTTPGATATPQSATTAVKAASGLAKHQQQHHQHHQSSSLARISPTSGEFGILPSLSSTSLISSNTSSSSMNTLTGSTQLGTVSASSSTSTATATPSKNPSFITAGARIRHASLGGPLISFSSNVSGKSREEIEAINNENELIFELVKDICNDLDVRSLCHKILKNVSILTNADRCSLFIVSVSPSPSASFFWFCLQFFTAAPIHSLVVVAQCLHSVFLTDDTLLRPKVALYQCTRCKANDDKHSVTKHVFPFHSQVRGEKNEPKTR